MRFNHGREVIASAAIVGIGFAVAGAVAAQDEVLLANGDRLTGVVMERGETVIVFEHATFGRLEIPVDQVARLTVDDLTVIDQPELVQAETPEEAVPPVPTGDWSFHLDLGGTGSWGNTDTQALRIAITGVRESTDDRTAVDAAYYYGATDGERTTNKVTAGILQDWFVPDSRWSYFASGRYDYDEFQSWDHRLGGHVGVGYQLYDKEDFDMLLRAGAGATKEWGSEGNPLRPEALLGTDITWAIDDRQNLTFVTTLYPDLGDLGEYRWVTDAKWTLLMAETSNLNISAGLRNEYQSEVDPGIEHNDLYVFAGLTLDF